MTNREYVMLAKDFAPDKHKIGGWFMSEKYDGQRAFWDGGCSRGRPKTEIPWANNAKDERYVDEPIATGLWSRYGNVIHAPDWWLDTLPNCLLDGELYLERGAFQETRKIVSRLVPDDRWRDIRFLVIDKPSYLAMFQAGRINNPNCQLTIKTAACERVTGPMMTWMPNFEEVTFSFPRGRTERVQQVRLPIREAEARDVLYDSLERVNRVGGEGLILRNPKSIWTPKRSANLLKVKPFNDDEATVKGYVWGTGKYLGMMGALVVEWEGKTFELGTGFTDDERRLYRSDIAVEAFYPGEVFHEMKGQPVESSLTKNPNFPLDKKVTFRYTSLTDDGIPREARHYRS